MNRTAFLRTLGLATPASLLALNAAEPAPPAASARRLFFNVRDYGAVGDGRALDTEALQRALDAAAAAGGGTVVLPPGRYRSGTLELRSHVTLRWEAGATLLGSADLAHYPARVPALRSYTDHYTERSLLYGEKLAGVRVEGPGVLDGQGGRFSGPYKQRPYLLRLIECRGVTVRDLTFRDSPMWVQHYLACDDVFIDGITVRSRCNANNDGIDLDACRNARIANCDLVSGDDAIVLKSTCDRPCRNVVIANCLLRSDCNAFKLGTESNGGFAHITLTNCVIYETRLSGIALEMVDGGTLEDVTISDVTLDAVNNPLFIRLGHRARPFSASAPAPGQGALRGVRVRGLRATGGNAIGCPISGLPGAPIQDVWLEDIALEVAGGGTAADAERTPPERPAAYPEHAMFGRLPACGFYCRHVEGLTLADVRVASGQPDHRPTLFCDDVRRLEVRRWRARTGSRVAALQLRAVRDAWLEGGLGPAAQRPFVELSGQENRNLHEIPPALRELTPPSPC